MRGSDDDEREEWRRRDLARARLAARDRLYDKEPGTTKLGDTDRRHTKRKYRKAQMPLRMQLRTRAILNVILDRDAHESLPSLFEVLVTLYLERYPIDDSLIPNDDELVSQFLEKQDEDDEDPSER